MAGPVRQPYSNSVPIPHVDCLKIPAQTLGLPLEQMLRHGRLNGHDVLLLLLLVLLLV
jgi:hypothetical protein